MVPLHIKDFKLFRVFPSVGLDNESLRIVSPVACVKAGPQISSGLIQMHALPISDVVFSYELLSSSYTNVFSKHFSNQNSRVAS